MATVITDVNYEQYANSGQILMIDFWAPWCGPCRTIAPTIDELAKEYEGKAIIGKINVDENPEICEEFGIRSIPTILFIKNGVQLGDKLVGGAPKSTLVSQLEMFLNL